MDNASLMKENNVIMEIPVHTTIAFAVTELEIRHDGHFGESCKIRVFHFSKNSLFTPRASPSAELCLMSDTKGGFEVDGPPQTKAMGVTGAPANNHLRHGEVLFGTFLPRCLLEGSDSHPQLFIHLLFFRQSWRCSVNISTCSPLCLSAQGPLCSSSLHRSWRSERPSSLFKVW